MCTASWLSAGEEFCFLFNRDERLSRARGLPPRFDRRAGVAWLAPVDGAAGGTWIAVNQHGLLLALLNRTDEGALPRSGARSRGSIIPTLVASPDAKSSDKGLVALDLRDCAPFRLLVRDPETGAIRAHSWNGNLLSAEELDPAAGLVCSSSLGDTRVTLARTPIWKRLLAAGSPLTLEALRAFQRSHEPAPSADSVCMHRDDAETVSHVEIQISRNRATMTYVDGPPCRHNSLAVETHELSR